MKKRSSFVAQEKIRLKKEKQRDISVQRKKDRRYRRHSDSYKSSGYSIDGESNLPTHIAVYKKHYKIIPDGYDVHHVDHNKHNNSVDNLIAIPRKMHKRIHVIYKDTGVKLTKSEIRKLYSELKVADIKAKFKRMSI